MSTRVENEVVSMQFDNRHFESNVQTSLSTLDKLKQSLKLQDAAKGFDGISAAAKKVTLEPLSSAVEKVGVKFSALYTIADQTLRNIVNSVQSRAKQIVSAFTIDPVKTGFSEYELKMGSIQTIMASTGESLASVNKYLNELNEYSDKTIYSFSDMTSNIGKFTNAGVKLEDAVAAIKGISNAAALSGANANEASRAMYNFSQALSAGHVKLIDWKSIELANMATVEFKTQLLEAAVGAGTLTKTTDGLYKTLKGTVVGPSKNFNESLNEQWMTTEVLVKTLNDYASETTDIGKRANEAATKVKTFSMMMDTLKESAQSGWAQTWEILVGDFNQGSNLWTGLSEVFGNFISKTAEARNSLLSGALDNSGWDKLTGKLEENEIAVSDFEDEVKKLAKENDIDIDKMIEEYGSLEAAVQDAKLPVDLLKKAVSNLFGKKDSKQFEEYSVKAGDTLSELAEKWGTSVEEIMFLNKQITDPDHIETGWIIKIPKALEETGEAAKKAEGELEDFNEIFKNVGALGGREYLIDSFKKIGKFLGKIFGSIGDGFKAALGVSSEQLFAVILKLNEFASGLSLSDDNADRLKRTFKGLFTTIKIAGTLIGGPLSIAFKLTNRLIEAFGGNILDVTARIGDGIVKLSDWLGGGMDKAVEWISSFLELPNVQAVLSRLRGEFERLKAILGPRLGEGWNNLLAWFDRIKKLDGFTWDNIVAGFKDLKKNVIDPLFQSKDGEGTIFDGIFESISSLWNEAKTKLKEIGVNLDEFGANVRSFFDSIGKLISENKGKIIAFASLIGLLLLIRKLSNVIGAFTAPFEFLDTLSNTLKSVKKSLQADTIKTIATSILMLVGAVAVLAYIPRDKLIQGGIALLAVSFILAGLYAALAGINKGLGSPGDTVKMAGSMILMTGALMLLAIAASKMADVEWEDLGKCGAALGSFVVILGIMAVLTKRTNGLGSSLSSFGKMMLMFSGALLIMAGTIALLGNLEPETIKQGGIAIGAMLGALVLVMAATRLLAKGRDDSIAKVGGMILAFSGALMMIATAVAIFGNMETETLVKGGLAVLAFMGLMVGVMAATRLLAKSGSGESVAKVGGIFAGMGASLLMIATAVAIFGNMETETLVKGGLAVLAFMGMMVGVMAATRLLAKTSGDQQVVKVAGTLLAFAGAVALLGIAVAVLGNLDISTLAKGVIAVTILGAVMAGLMAVTKLVPQKAVGTILGVAIAMVLLSAAVAALSFIEPEGLKGAVTAVAVIGAVMAGLMVATKFMKIGLKTVGAILILGGIVAGLAFVIKELSGVDADTSVGIAKALAILITTLTGCAAGLGVLGKLGPGALWGVAILAGIVAVLGVAMWAALANLPEIGTQLSLFMLNLTPFLVGVGLFKSSGLLDGVKTLAEAIMLLCSASLMTAIGNLGGGMTGAFDTLVEWIKQMLEVVKTFATDISTDGTKIDAAKLRVILDAVKVLAECAALAPKDISIGWGAYTETTDLAGFAEWIRASSDAVATIAKDLSNKDIKINKNNLTAITDAVRALAEAASVAPRKQEFALGNKSAGIRYVDVPMLTEFTTWVKDVATAIKDVAVDVSSKTINTKSLTAISQAAKDLAEAAALAPRETTLEVMEGKTLKFTNTAMLKEFGDWISDVSNALKNVAIVDPKQKFDGNRLKSIATAAKTLAEAAALAPRETTLGVVAGGKFALGFTDSAMLTEFSTWITDVSEALKNVATISTDPKVKTKFDATMLTSIATNAKTLAEAAALAPRKKTYKSFFSEYSDVADLEAVKKWIDEVASKIKDFAIDISTKKIDDKKVTAVVTAAKALAEAARLAPPKTTYESAFVDFVVASDIESVKSWIDTVVPVIKGFAIDVSAKKIDDKKVTAVATAAKSLAEAANIAPKSTNYTGVFGVGFVSQTDIAEVKGWITEVAPVLQGFAVNVSADSIKTDNVTAIAEAAKVLAEAAATAPKHTELHAGGIHYVETALFTDLATWLTNIETPLKSFVNISSVEGVDADNVKKVAEAAKTIAEAAATAPTVGQFHAGPIHYIEATDFNGFATWLTTIIDSLATVSGAVTAAEGEKAINIDVEKITAVATSAKLLSEAAATVPRAGNVFDKLMGNYPDYGSFISWIGQLATPLSEFSTKISTATIDVAKISAIATAGIKLSQMTTMLDAGSFIDSLNKFNPFADSKEDTFKGFFGFLDGLATNMSTFSTTISEANIDPVAVEKVATAAHLLSKARAIVDEVGTVDSEAGTGFGTFIENVAKNIANFFTNLGDINVESVSLASNSVKALADAMKIISELGSFVSVDTISFGTKLEEISASMGTFATNMEGVDVSAAATNVDTLVNTLSNMSGKTFDGAGSFKDSLSKVAEASITDFTTAFTNADTTTAIQTAGGSLMTNIGTGATDNSDELTTTLTTILTDLPSAIMTEEVLNGFSGAGKNAVEGFANGITNNQYLATDAGSALGKAALQAAKDALDEHSPSREFYQVGDFAGIALVDALISYEDKAYKAGYGVGESSKFGLGDALNKVHDLIENGVDSQPTIRPVLDLSAVSAGASSINGMFGMTPSVGVMAKVNSINKMMNEHQNGGNEDIISAIHDLGNAIGQTSGNTYNVNGVTYDDGSNIAETVKSLIRAAVIERRV